MKWILWALAAFAFVWAMFKFVIGPLIEAAKSGVSWTGWGCFVAAGLALALNRFRDEEIRCIYRGVGVLALILAGEALLLIPIR